MAKQEEKAATPPPVPGVSVEDLAGLASDGLGNLRQDDLSIPFLSILQDGSPQVKRQEGDYIPGAVPGMVLNTVSKKLYDVLHLQAPGKDKLTVVPCGYKKLWIEWKPRNKGGGIAAVHATDEILKQTKKDDKNKDVLPNGNNVVATAYHSVMVLEDGGSFYPAIIAMASTQLKVSKKWNTVMSSIQLEHPVTKQKFNPPAYAFKYAVTTKPESNNDGSWFGWKIEMIGRVETSDVFAKSKELSAQVKEQPLALGYSHEEAEETTDGKSPF